MSADDEPAGVGDGPEGADGGDGPDGADGGDAGGGLERPDEKPEWLSLDEGEELRWVGQPSTASLASALIWGVVLIPLLGLGLLVIAASLVSVFNTDYVVTNTSLYHKRGVLSTNIESVGLDRIQNTEYSQSFFGKQLGYGTIEISTAGSGGADLSFSGIESPREVRDLVTRLSNTVGGTAGGTGGGEEATGGAAAGTRAELLEQLLVELREVNDAMADVERLLREERGEPGGASRGGRSGASSAETATERDATGSAGGATGGGYDGGGDADPDDGGETASEFVAGSSRETTSGADPDDGGSTTGGALPDDAVPKDAIPDEGIPEDTLPDDGDGDEEGEHPWAPLDEDEEG